jgi:hypothetical protein
MVASLVLIVLALAVLWFVAAPLLRSDAAESERLVSAESAAVELQSRHTMLLASLADLEEDRATGKLDDADYEELHESLTVQAVDVLKKIDTLPDPRAAAAPLGPRPLDTGSDESA